MSLQDSKEEPTEASEPKDPSPGQGHSVRAWIAAHRFVALGVGIGLAVILGGALAYWTIASRAKPDSVKTALAAALEAIDQEDYDEAKDLLETLSEETAASSETDPVALYARGVMAARDADQACPVDQRRLALLASRYLEKARSLGFPHGHEPEGFSLLGRSLSQAGQVDAAQAVLGDVIENDPERAAEIRWLLTDAYLSEATPRIAEASEQNRALLAEETLDPALRHRALLQRAEIFLQSNKPGHCLQTLDQISVGAPPLADVMVLRARVRMNAARKLAAQAADAGPRKAQAEYQAAIALLRQAADRDSPRGPVIAKAMYLIGICLMETGQPKAALDQFARTRSLNPDTLEAFASLFHEAELHRQLHQDDDALVAHLRVLRTFGDPESYFNPWISLEQLRGCTIAAYQHRLESGDYPACLQLAKAMYPLLSRERMTQAIADARRAWGRNLIGQAEQAPAGKAGLLASQGRAELRKAGRAYADLAKARFATREYPGDVWDAATNYREGHDFRSAAAWYREYLKQEMRRRQAEAMVLEAESLLSMDRVNEACETLRKCLVLYPRDAWSYRARLLASAGQIEKGDFQEAQRLLEKNLDGASLTPASKEWRESLFALGRLLHDTGRYDEAVRRLEEAVKRYPETPQAVEARYLIGDCLRQSARDEAGKLDGELVEEVRLTRTKRIRELRTASLEQYRQTEESLLKQQENRELDAPEEAMLRNCYFAVGGILYDLEQYDASIRAYGMAANRYQESPEVLEAYLQMARAYRQLSKPQEARGSVEQARMVLARLKTQPCFQETTNYSPQEWEDVLR